MQQYEGIVFDCDGTLADTMPAHYIAWCRTLERYGMKLPEERFYSLGGWKTDAIITLLAAEHGLEVDAQSMSHEKELAFLEHLDSVRPIDEVVSVAREYSGRKPMAVATGNVRWATEKVLKQIGMDGFFEIIVTADDVTNHKPHPETYLEAAKRLNVDPGRCVAYEDAEPGIVSARAAGMHVIDVRLIRGKPASGR